jgi:hypothetical protein
MGDRKPRADSPWPLAAFPLKTPVGLCSAGAERFLSCRIFSRGSVTALSGVKPCSASSQAVTSQNVRAACERQWASMGAGANRRLPNFSVSSAVRGTMSAHCGCRVGRRERAQTAPDRTAPMTADEQPGGAPAPSLPARSRGGSRGPRIQKRCLGSIRHPSTTAEAYSEAASRAYRPAFAPRIERPAGSC